MIKQFSNTIRLIKTIINIHHANHLKGKYHLWSKRLIQETLQKHHLKEDSSIPSFTRAKMQWYMASSIWTCELYNQLLNQHSDPEKKRSYMLNGGAMAICDILIDDLDTDPERVDVLKRPPHDLIPENTLEAFYLAFYREFIQSLTDQTKEEAIRYYELTYEAQVKSKLQLDPYSHPKDIDEVCKEKCGYWMLFLRALINIPISETERKAWYELGGFIQYCNDAQDLHKDSKKGLRSFANTRPDLETLIKDLDNQRKQTFQTIKETTLDKKQKDFVLFLFQSMYIGILSKINFFNQRCEGNFTLERFLDKKKEEVRPKVFSFTSLKYGLPKILNYEYNQVSKNSTFGLEH